MAALEHVRVLELTHFLAGPYAGLVLADMGAEVIKLEDPDHPDEVRHLAPLDTAGDSLYFAALNWGKRSMGVRLSDPAARQVLRDLIASSDVLLDNFRPGVLRRLRLAHDTVSAINPRLITCSITGFGETGPYAHWPGYDYTIQAQSGVMGLGGEPDGPPTKAGISYVDHAGGIAAAAAINAALVERSRTGVGQHIDLGLLDVQISMLTYLAAWNLNAGVLPKRRANSAHPSLVPAQNFRTADGYIALFVGNDGMWRRLVAVVDDELLSEEQYGTQAGRLRHAERLTGRLQQIFLKETSSHWMHRFSGAGIACGAVNDIAAALADAQVEARGLVAGTDFRHVRGPVISMSGSGSAPSPRLGQDSSDVLESLGYSPERIGALLQDGVVYSG